MHRTATMKRLWGALRLTGDLLAAAASLYGAFLVRIRFHLPFTEELLPSDRLALAASTGGVVTALVLQVATLYLFGFYDPPEPQPRMETARRLLPAVGLQGLTMTSFYFLTGAAFPRSVLVLYVVLDLALLLAWRLLLDRLDTPPRRRVALVGSGPEAVEIAAKIRQFGFHGLDIVGFATPPGEPPASAEDREVLGPDLGSLERIPELIREGRLDDVILAATPRDWRTGFIDALAAVRPAEADLLLLPGPFESLLGRMRYRWVRDIPLIEVVNHSEWRMRRPVKRLLDVAAGALLFLLALPVMAVCAAAVKLTSPGPVLYRQERVGRGRQSFTLWKLRTMQVDAERDTGEVLSHPGDPRLTPVGATLRRFRLDEVPQLWNVLNGTMSLVGPRPERPGFVQRYLREIPGYAERFAVSPGLTGLAQVSGEYLSTAGNKLRYDLAYIANWSLWLDVSILLRTAKIVLTSRGT